MSADKKPFYYYLDCSFDENDEVKSLGAKFLWEKKKWYVPKELYPTIHRFNRFRPNQRFYLKCPIEEKDEAKAKGAKWDWDVRAWYVECKKTDEVPARFARWLPEFGDDNIQPDAPVSSRSSPSSKSTKTPAKVNPPPAASISSSASKKRGNAQDAATLRISEDMTVSQLLEECRLRGIRGLAGKKKDWLLDQLGLGSVWQSMSMKQVPKATQTKGNATTQPKPTAPPAKKTKPAKSQPVDWESLPKVTSELTVDQLKHELLHRQLNLKGISNKTKSWFLERLGQHSIWATSPQAKAIAFHPVVNSSLTVAQLKHELLSRSNNTMKGLSSKTKTDLLEFAGEGSLWTTAPPALVNRNVASSTSLPPRATPSSSPRFTVMTELKENQPKGFITTNIMENEFQNMRGEESENNKQEVQLSKDGIPVVTRSMTINELKEEMTCRNPYASGLSGKNKDWFLERLQIGSELHSSAEFHSRAQAKARAAKLHTHKCPCHEHLLADSSLLVSNFDNTATRSQNDFCAVMYCDICAGTPYRSCEECDWDICRVCFDIESLPTEKERFEAVRRLELEAKGDSASYDSNENDGSEDDEDDEEEEGEDESPVQKSGPMDVHAFVNDFPQETMSSPKGRLEELRRKRAEKEEAYRLQHQQTIQRLQEPGIKDHVPAKRVASRKHLFKIVGGVRYPGDEAFPENIRNLRSVNNNPSSKLKYTIWTSTQEDHSDKKFDSSFETLQEANQRVEFAYYDGEYVLYNEHDKMLPGGLRMMSCGVEDEAWTVSVVPSEHF